MSKFSLEVLERRVFPYIFCNDPAVILGAAFGEDVALTRVEEGILVSHVDPLKMISSGTLVATVPPEKLGEARRVLNEIPVAVTNIGRVVAGKGVKVMEKEKISTFENIHCEEDELARMWEIYTPDQE